MLYATMTFWLMLTVLAAWGVLRLWSQLVRPRVINIVLLPGTLVAHLGHFLGLLVTGATVDGAGSQADAPDESGGGGTARSRIPVLGPMLIGVLPLLACGGALVLVARSLGARGSGGFWQERLPDALPTSLHGVWQLLRHQITMMEHLVDVAVGAFPGTWRLWLFLYLLICLTVRMAPFRGQMRGALSAILALGLVAAVVGLVSDALPSYIHAGWTLLSLTVPTVLLLLTISALVRGAVGLSRLVAHNE